MLFRVQAVGNGGEVVRRQLLEQLDGLQDLLMRSAPSNNRGDDNGPEAGAVECPQHPARLGLGVCTPLYISLLYQVYSRYT